jgi:hypothetical protein
MAFLERLKLRRSASGEPGGEAAPFALPVAPRLKARITELGQLFYPGRGPRRLFPSAKLDAAPPDPSKILFPVGEALDDAPGDGEALSRRLHYSAGAIVRRQNELAEQARVLSAAIAARLGGAVSLGAWAIRIMVAFAWAGLAAQFAWALMSDSAAPIIGFGPVAAKDLRALMMVFGLAAAAGIGGVMIGVLMVFASGNADNRKVRERAAAFGERAAELARQFDAELDKLRRAMDARSNPVDAVADLSRAHLTALEAAVFFRNIQFVTDDTEAQQKFRGYLGRAPGGGGGASDMPAFLLGVAVGVSGTLLVATTPVALPVATKLAYPAAGLWIMAGGLVYLFAGLLAETMRGLIAMGAANEAREAALDAVRSGFVSGDAPRVDTVIRRIEDALDVYKARVARPGAKTSAADDIPAWRKAPEAPRFVDAGFQAAPKSFLVGPQDASTGRRNRRPGKKN